MKKEVCNGLLCGNRFTLKPTPASLSTILCKPQILYYKQASIRSPKLYLVSSAPGRYKPPPATLFFIHRDWQRTPEPSLWREVRSTITAIPWTTPAKFWGQVTFRSGGLTNDNVVSFVDADVTVYGDVINNANLSITNNTTTFFDLVTNTGTIMNTAGTMRFLGGLVNSGALYKRPGRKYLHRPYKNRSRLSVGRPRRPLPHQRQFLQQQCQ